MEQIAQLLEIYTAKNIKMSEGDIKCFCQGIINSMKKDGLTLKDLTVDALQAYAIHEVKKMQSFTNTYFSNPKARKAFQRYAMAQL